MNLYQEWAEMAYCINVYTGGHQTLSVNGTFGAKSEFLQSPCTVKVYTLVAKKTTELKVFKTRFCFEKNKIFTTSKGKGKVIPLQARCGPEGGYSYNSTVP